MTNQTKIEWTDFTVNFWEGCQKVGLGCDFCYAEARNVRFKGDNWGPGKPRRWVKGGIAKLRKINRRAGAFYEKHGHWPRVFCSSLSDVFDNAVDLEWRIRAFNEIELARDCRIQLLTKRVGNVEKMVRDIWDGGAWPQHVGLMITVVNQAEADRDIPKLLDLKARLGIPWVGLSMEPLLGPVDLTAIPDPSGLAHSHMDALRGKFWMPPEHVDWPTSSRAVDGRLNVNLCPWVDWVIVGGESGRKARPMHPDWVRSLRDQCEAAGTPLLFKQWGRYLHESQDPNGLWDWADGDHRNILHHWPDGTASISLSKKRAGRLLDGIEHNGFPGTLT